MLATHRFYQVEKPTDGGHWRNIKNPVYKSIGIGVWARRPDSAGE